MGTDPGPGEASTSSEHGASRYLNEIFLFAYYHHTFEDQKLFPSPTASSCKSSSSPLRPACYKVRCPSLLIILYKLVANHFRTSG
ncbi:hypothetical protein GQ457_01G003480 [Hibiscus cannabinus]